MPRTPWFCIRPLILLLEFKVLMRVIIEISALVLKATALGGKIDSQNAKILKFYWLLNSVLLFIKNYWLADF